MDPWGLWTVQIGISGTGGTSMGGTGGGGIVFGYSRERGFHGGIYGNTGGGGYISQSGSITIDLTWSKNGNINDLSGATATAGGSGTILGISAGGEVNIPMRGNAEPSYTVSGGGGVGLPGEVHGFYARTWIKELFSFFGKGEDKGKCK